MTSIRAMVFLLQAYMGASPCRDSRSWTSLHLHHSELSGDAIPGAPPLKLTPHEDILLLRMTAQQQQTIPKSLSVQRRPSSDVPLASVARGAGDAKVSATFSLSDISETGASRPVCPLALVTSPFPQFSESGEACYDNWPVGRPIAVLIRQVFEKLSAAQRVSESHNIDDITASEVADSSSVLALLLEWQSFILPFLKREAKVEGEIGQRKNLGAEDGDSMLSSTILQIARIAATIDGPPDGGFVTSPGPPSIVPRAVMLALTVRDIYASESGKAQSYFPVQSRALMLAVNTCCDLVGVSYQTRRQLECLVCLLTALVNSSSAVLTELAAWALPKLMQTME